MKNILITGGMGFIGSHCIRHFVKKYQDLYHVYNLDTLTYAGNAKNVADISHYDNYTFLPLDIGNQPGVEKLFDEIAFDKILHLAAESHVDQSIKNPLRFAKTNIIGTLILLNAAIKQQQKVNPNLRFHHVSTDEVYGSLSEKGYFYEHSPYDPQSPYSASKASSDHFVRAYHHTYGLDVVITNCSNNYGPFQFPEKLIPVIIHALIGKQKIPIYGKGINIRDWIWVEDHVQALDLVLHNGEKGQTYNIGGASELKNIDLTKKLCDLYDRIENQAIGTSQELICFVKDRAGHDLRYAIDNEKINKTLGWSPKKKIEQGLEETLRWYLKHQQWSKESLDKIKNG